MARRIVWTVSLTLTGVIVFFHLYYAFHAGGLWRDEANTVAIARMRPISDLWGHLEYDSFPILWFLIVRLFQSLGLATDFGFRLLGCFVGLSIVAALWMNARLLKLSAPLVSLVLLGFSPTIIRWGDSMRAYGFGICLLLLTFGLVWRVTTSPSVWSVALAMVAAVCSVQTLYYNAVTLFAIGIAGVAVAVRNRHWYRTLLVLSIGGTAALSLLPYLHTIQLAKEWNNVFTLQDFSFAIFWLKLTEALSSAGRGVAWLWVILIIGAAVAAIIVQLYSASSPEGDRRDAALYCLTALLISIPAYFGFLKILSYPTQPWYYVVLMALVAVAADGALSALPWQWWRNTGRMLLAPGIAIWSFVPTWGAMHIRQTNLDIIAAKLEEAAEAGDVIVVAPWYFGVTFERYYKGAAQWMTLPPIDDNKIHRYDLLKERMAATNPIDSVLDAMANGLRSGHKVWIVGSISFPQPGKTPLLLAPAPYDVVGWNEGAYTTTWSLQAGHFLQTHALTAKAVALPSDQPINPYEDAQLIVVRGWRW